MSKMTLAATALVAGAALIAAACGGGTSSADKTATAGAGKGAATSAATKAATTPAAAATTAATKAATTPAAGATTAATAATGTTGAATGVTVADSPLGKILVDNKGFTLYTFKNDVAGNGKSAAEALVALWPPLSLSAAPASVTGATGAWATFTRVDAKTQVTYKGMPLYYFANDKAAGDTKGDKVGGVWFVAVP